LWGGAHFSQTFGTRDWLTQRLSVKVEHGIEGLGLHCVHEAP